MPDWGKLWGLLERGHEIGAHTWHHENLRTSPHYRREIREGQAIIREKLLEAATQLTGDRERDGNRARKLVDDKVAVTMSYPYGDRHGGAIDAAAEFHLWARTTSTHLLLWKEIEEGTSRPGSKMVYEIPSTGFWRSSTKLSEVHALLNRSIEGSGLFVDMFHGMDGAGYDPIPSSTFIAHLDHLRRQAKKGMVWVATFADVTKYLHERAAVEFYDTRHMHPPSPPSSSSSSSSSFTIFATRLRLRNAFALQRLTAFRPGLSLHPLTLSVSVRIHCLTSVLRVRVDGEEVKVSSLNEQFGAGKMPSSTRKLTFEVTPSLTSAKLIEIMCDPTV